MIKQSYTGELIAELGLCQDRHEGMPVEESIFPNVVPVMGFGKLELMAQETLEPLSQQGVVKLVIYVTGCIPALIAALNVANQLKFRAIELRHYDSIAQGYQSQTFKTISDLTI